MKRSRLLRATFVLTFVCCFVPLFAQSSAAAPRVVQARTTASIALPSSTEATSVQSVTLTSGPWTVIGKAFVVDQTYPESDFFRCELFNSAAGKHLDVAAAWVSSEVDGSM